MWIGVRCVLEAVFERSSSFFLSASISQVLVLYRSVATLIIICIVQEDFIDIFMMRGSCFCSVISQATLDDLEIIIDLRMDS